MSENLTIQELRVEIDWFCGCGSPEQAADTLLRILDLHPLYEHRDEFDAAVPEPLQYLLLYLLDAVTERKSGQREGWFEHGGGIGGQWLTDRGKAVQKALRREKDVDNFKRLFPKFGPCVHGFALGDEGYAEHDCLAVV